MKVTRWVDEMTAADWAVWREAADRLRARPIPAGESGSADQAAPPGVPSVTVPAVPDRRSPRHQRGTRRRG